MPGSEPRDEFELTGLAKIRARRKWVWAWFFVAIPVVFVLSSLAPGVAPRWTRAASLLVWMVLIWRHALVRCPNCRQAFNREGLRSNPWTSHCMHCGLLLDGSGSEPPRV